MKESIDTSELNIKGDLWFNIRNVSRFLTKYYDKYFEGLGITCTWFISMWVVVNFSKYGSIEKAGNSILMDRTTLSRSLKLLMKVGLVDRELVDGKRYHFYLTENGEKKFLEAIPCWNVASEDFKRVVGKRYYRKFLVDIEVCESFIEELE